MSDKKRMFQVLDEMNIHDAQHSTQSVIICPDVTEMNHLKKGTKVTMGVPAGIIHIADQLRDKPKKIIFLMVVDREEYERRLNADTQQQ